LQPYPVFTMTSREDDILDLLEIEDLPEAMQLVAQLMGIDTVKAMIRECGGIQFYVPTLNRTQTLLYRYIKTKGVITLRDKQALARDLGVTSRYLDDIVRKGDRQGV